ncbi:MAG: hypothetical protein ABEI13_04285 [Candidatus Paceibacteria bacterium]
MVITEKAHSQSQFHSLIQTIEKILEHSNLTQISDPEMYKKMVSVLARNFIYLSVHEKRSLKHYLENHRSLCNTSNTHADQWLPLYLLLKTDDLSHLAQTVAQLTYMQYIYYTEVVLRTRFQYQSHNKNQECTISAQEDRWIYHTYFTEIYTMISEEAQEKIMRDLSPIYEVAISSTDFEWIIDEELYHLAKRDIDRENGQFIFHRMKNPVKEILAGKKKAHRSKNRLDRYLRSFSNSYIPLMYEFAETISS